MLSRLCCACCACCADNEDERNRIERFNPNPKLPLVGRPAAACQPGICGRTPAGHLACVSRAGILLPC